MSEDKYNEIASRLSSRSNVVIGQMFGKSCVKVNGKAFLSFFKGCMIFKLTDDAHSIALSLDGACLWDPSGKGRPMKEWVEIPDAHSSQWDKFADLAYDYVYSLTMK